MIPFRDNIPSRRYPVTTLLLILANVAIFLYQLSLPPADLESMVHRNAVVPAQLLSLSSHPVQLAAESGRTLLWSMFLHAGWFHLLGNMWYLGIFGDSVEERMGHFRFLMFYLTCGALAGFAHIYFNLGSSIPSIGASGAVAGVLGAYLISYPFARVMTLVPLFFFWPIIELPALLVLGSWFFVQLLNGAATLTAATAETTGGVAWWAHIGGFVAGSLLIWIFAKRPVRRYSWSS